MSKTIGKILGHIGGCRADYTVATIENELRCFIAIHPCLLFFIEMGSETVVRQGLLKILGHTHCPKTIFWVGFLWCVSAYKVVKVQIGDAVSMSVWVQQPVVTNTMSV